MKIRSIAAAAGLFLGITLLAACGEPQEPIRVMKTQAAAIEYAGEGATA